MKPLDQISQFQLDLLWVRSLKLETQVTEKDPNEQLTQHDFWSNSVEGIAEDDDVIQFMIDNPPQAAKLLVALNALEVTYQQIKAEAEAQDAEENDEEEEEDFDEDEE